MVISVRQHLRGADCREPFSGCSTDLANHRKCVSNFASEPDWQIENATILTGQSRDVLKSWYTGLGPEQE